MKSLPMTEERATAARHFAQEILTEANERGDQDNETVAWVVWWLLRRANEPRPEAGIFRADARCFQARA